MVETVEETAERLVQLLKASALRQKIGAAARESVRENLLLSRLVEDWIDLLGSPIDRERYRLEAESLNELTDLD